MNNTDPTLPMAHPPISSSSDMLPRDTLLQRGAFDPPAAPGTLGRLDRFEILRLIGEGGMGQVYLAREPLTDTQVAIKIMKPDAADDPREVHRFLTEARHMYRLAHPRILRVLEVSGRPAGPYYVMPYVAGGSLLARCKPGETLPETEVLAIARQVAEALAHAHAHGLIHRDLKPGNVLLDKDGNAYLTDFGLVRTLFNDSMVDATASHLEGTAPYMSPAVARGEAEDTRCDIYAFGALLYELLAGKPPYTGRTPQIILDQVLKGPPAPLREVNPKASPTLVKIAEGCMARELRDRYASMADVVADLDRTAQGKAPLGPHGRQRRNLPRLVAVAAGVTIALVTAGLWHSSLRSSKRASPRAGSMAADDSPLASLPDVDVARPPEAEGKRGDDPPDTSPIVASGDTPEEPFLYTVTDGQVTITKYTGPGGKVTIPTEVDNLPVTAVGNRAFHKRGDISAVIIPDSVLAIGNEAFLLCSLLEYVVLPKEITVIPELAFSRCYSLKNVAIPECVERIDEKAFFMCRSLTNVVLSAALTRIGREAFADCSSLGQISVPEGVESVEEKCFQGCSLLSWATLASRVRRIEPFAFANCPDLTSLRFAGDAPQVLGSPFANSAKLTIYYRPGTKGWGKEFGGRPTAVWEGAQPASQPSSFSPHPSSLPETSIHDFAFVAEGDGVAVVKYAGDGGMVVIPAKVNGLPVTTVKDEAFQNCTTLTDVIIPNNVTNIGFAAFRDCSGLVNVMLGSGITSIGDSAFANCTRLAKVVVPNGVTRLGGWAFAGCTSLTHVTIPANLPLVEAYMFDGCSRLVSILVDPLHPKYSSSADGVLFNKDRSVIRCYPPGRIGSYAIPNSVKCIGNNSFRNCTQLTSVIIPNSVTEIRGCRSLTSVVLPDELSSIGGMAFDGCISLANLTIPKGVTHIEDCAFRGCASLPSVRIPDGITSIEGHWGGGTFNGCAALKSVVIPDSVKSLGVCAFSGCTNLANVTIGKGVTDIDSWVFASCTPLTHVFFKGDAPKGASDGTVFDGVYNATVYYRPGTKGWGPTFGGRPVKVWKED